MQIEETIQEDPHSAIVYFSPDEGVDAPEILLFEEKAIFSKKWRTKASQTGKRLWERTRDRFDQISSDIFAGDRFIHRLKGFKKITVLLNKPIDPVLVRDRLRAIFRDRSYHHLRWLVIDALLLPVALLIAPLPGPNIIGYFLVFRVFSHWRTFRSASRAALEDIDVQVSNDAEEVNATLRKGKDVRAALQELRKKYGLRALQEHEFIPQLSVLREAWTRMKRSFHREEGS